MNACFSYHVSEDVLETYAMGMLSDEDCAPLEEHLLLCCICQRRLEQTDEYIRIIIAAASNLSNSSTAAIRRFVPEFRIPATIPPTALLFPSALNLTNIGFGFTTLVALGRFCVNTAWTWNGTPRLG
jgi:hypothetical protein